MRCVGFVVLMVCGLLTTAEAGSIYKCKQADGSVTFSNVSCPDDTVDSEYRGEHRERQEWEDESENYYSATRQMQRVEQKNAAEKYQRGMQRRQAAASKANRAAQKRQQVPAPVLTYDQAKRKALKEEGFRGSSNLTKLQRERVNRTMSGYNHLPR